MEQQRSKDYDEGYQQALNDVWNDLEGSDIISEFDLHQTLHHLGCEFHSEDDE